MFINSLQERYFLEKRQKVVLYPLPLVSYSLSLIIGCSISYVIGIPISVAI